MPRGLCVWLVLTIVPLARVLVCWVLTLALVRGACVLRLLRPVAHVEPRVVAGVQHLQVIEEQAGAVAAKHVDQRAHSHRGVAVPRHRLAA